MDLTSTLTYSAIALAPVLLAWAFRKRLITWISSRIAQSLVEWAFVAEDVEDADGKKMRKMSLSAPAKAILAATLPTLIEQGLAAVKIKLPKFAPINPSTGQLDFTAGIAAKMADGKKVSAEEIAKTLFMQIGMPLIEQKLVPAIQGMVGGIGQAAKAGSPGKAGLSAEAQKLVDEAMR